MPPRPCSKSTGELLGTYQRLFSRHHQKVSLIASACLAWHDAALTKLDRATLGEIPMTPLGSVCRFAALAF